LTRAPRGVALVMVGDELLDGRVRDTNSAWLIERITVLRGCVDSLRVVPDDVAGIAAAILHGSAESAAVVVAGGLGPTSDDLSREGLARAAQEELVLDLELLAALHERWRRRGRTMPESNRRQAYRTVSGKPIPNPRGTAPGLLHLLDGVPVVLLPGVPAELHAMWEATAEGIVAPLVAGNAPRRLRLRTARLPESALADAVDAALGQGGAIERGYLVNEFGVDLLLLAGDEQADLDAAGATLLARLAPHVYAVGDAGLERVVVEELLRRRQTLSVAESCTAGLLGGCLTRVPGSSAAFRGGVIAYHDAVKVEALGVPEDLLRSFGAVSEEAARAMATGVRDRLRTDWGLAVTGIAGPAGATAEKPVGMTWVALAGPGATQAERSAFPGDRTQNRTWSVAAALDLLRRALAIQPRLP
jgi:nicotinamide-nucleotide amidase